MRISQDVTCRCEAEPHSDRGRALGYEVMKTATVELTRLCIPADTCISFRLTLDILHLQRTLHQRSTSF
jgi:hypothetical protein